ncbi:hypothetical protein PVAP13_1KG387200 [Panicum virgatum]|uniref:Uncharacterized protein n=1 Tax=Panicum virgatum TaxID=38727 RepID=A0A8T0QZR0_PANVG|nr:hypothetical protein PVAP13_6NG114912 [Panicum virgatum]KAG2659966.1 hypothetical protein PVAP13_1KG387200 [Panicum virgatum]
MLQLDQQLQGDVSRMLGLTKVTGLLNMNANRKAF